MRKLYVLLGTFLVGAFIGCAQDPNEEAISKTIATLQDTTRTIDQIATILNTEIEAAKKERDPKKPGMDVTKLLEAKTKAEELKKLATTLQEIKAKTDTMREGVTKEQREALAKKYKDNFQAAANELSTAERKLEEKMKEAEQLATTRGEEVKAAMKGLRETLQASQKEFAVLTKKQT
jgi:hypothetical protein